MTFQSDTQVLVHCPKCGGASFVPVHVKSVSIENEYARKKDDNRAVLIYRLEATFHPTGTSEEHVCQEPTDGLRPIERFVEVGHLDDTRNPLVRVDPMIMMKY